ncbi:MAG TPA: hypothetical protein VF347_02510, partial [Candidatus Humimicrobiaceae bacterium]
EAGQTTANKEKTGELFEKVVNKEDTATAPGKIRTNEGAETLTDKAVYKKDARAVTGELAAKEIAEKKESIELKDDFTAGLPKDLKKTSGGFAQLIPEIWENVLVKIKVKSVPLQAILKEVKKFNIQGNKIFFSLEPKNRWHKGELNKLENRALVQELLKSLTGEKFEITFDFISDENKSESIDLSHPARKIRASGDLLPEHKETLGFNDESANASAGSSKAEAGGSIAASKNSRDGKDTVIGSDTYEYFEEKFKLKEK